VRVVTGFLRACGPTSAHVDGIVIQSAKPSGSQVACTALFAMPNIFALVFPAPDGECQIVTNATGNMVTPLRSFPDTKLILTALALSPGPDLRGSNSK
jgi:hypothetical protein